MRTTRVGGGGGGAAVAVSDLLRVVRNRVGGGGDLEPKLDELVKRLGGQRRNFADTAGYFWKLRRFFGQSSERPEDVHVLPVSIAPPPYDEPY